MCTPILCLISLHECSFSFAATGFQGELMWSVVCVCVSCHSGAVCMLAVSQEAQRHAFIVCVNDHPGTDAGDFSLRPANVRGAMLHPDPRPRTKRCRANT